MFFYHISLQFRNTKVGVNQKRECIFDFYGMLIYWLPKPVVPSSACMCVCFISSLRIEPLCVSNKLRAVADSSMLPFGWLTFEQKSRQPWVLDMSCSPDRTYCLFNHNSHLLTEVGWGEVCVWWFRGGGLLWLVKHKQEASKWACGCVCVWVGVGVGVCGCVWGVCVCVW